MNALGRRSRSRGAAPVVGGEWSKVRNYLQAEETLTFLDRLHRQLQEVAPEEPLRGELVRLWWLRRQRPRAATAGMIAALAMWRIWCNGWSATGRGRIGTGCIGRWRECCVRRCGPAVRWSV